ncbi:hypothetical protein RCH20_000405 [Psychrobacter sp. PL15]|uniref:hypothetical protein n=1 Tax=Psychrobacter sp. PL15 TaxID=3071719 RepID=UPI002DF9B416|nr:hypothetical protein [Psychrobacter sp. PL15]
MKQILKHSFEAVSLLTTDNGMLDVTIVPALNQLDWIIPSSLILSVDDYHERIWIYLWQQQEVAVFHMLPRDQVVDKIVVLEGNTPAHRVALQTAGELHQVKVRISDVKDIDLPKYYVDVALSNIDANKIKDDSTNIYQSLSVSTADDTINAVEEHFRENVVQSYLFQTVIIDDTLYLVPDLDKIAHQLVDLDR